MAQNQTFAIPCKTSDMSWSWAVFLLKIKILIFNLPLFVFAQLLPFVVFQQWRRVNWTPINVEKTSYLSAVAIWISPYINLKTYKEMDLYSQPDTYLQLNKNLSFFLTRTWNLSSNCPFPTQGPLLLWATNQQWASPQSVESFHNSFSKLKCLSFLNPHIGRTEQLFAKRNNITMHQKVFISLEHNWERESFQDLFFLCNWNTWTPTCSFLFVSCQLRALGSAVGGWGSPTA